MSKEIVLDISTSGRTEGLHFDEFPLQFLGELSISRASEIFFNSGKQNWGVILPGHKEALPVARDFTGYDRAREFEVTWLQSCRKGDVLPDSIEGRKLALKVRPFA